MYDFYEGIYRMETKAFIKKYKVISIARGIYGQDLFALATALQKGGLRLIELTFDQKDPNDIQKTGEGIALLNTIEGVQVGAGTVLNLEQLQAAYTAGAKYIVSPNVDANIIKATKELGLVSIPGACTPTEIMQAYHAGADFVKVFPAMPLGMEYLKAVCLPLNHIPFIANAGIDQNNLQDILKIGFAGAGISNYLSDKNIIAKGDFEEFIKRAQKIMHIVEQAQ